jgi:AcrR family transcriptional regulator
MAIRQKCDKKRKALLNATLKLVNNNGFHDAPMSKIAKMAAVSPATIYIYFENKQDLINQLYLEVKAEFSAYAFKNYNEEQCIKDSFKQVWMNIADFKLNQIEASNFLSQCDNAPMIDEESRQAGFIGIVGTRTAKRYFKVNFTLFIVRLHHLSLGFFIEYETKKIVRINRQKFRRSFSSRLG